MRSSRICWASRLLLCLAALWLAPQAQAAIALVNTASGEFTASGTAQATVASGAITVSAGNLLVVFCAGNSSDTGTLTATDTGSANTFTSIATTGNANDILTAFYAQNTAAVVGDVITCHYSVSQAFPAVAVLQYSGVATSGALDTSAVGQGFASTYTTASFTTTSANEALVAGFTQNNTGTVWTAGTGYTIEVTDTNTIAGAEDQIVAAVQTGVTASVTNNTASNGAIIVATFAAAAATAPGRTLLGVGQ